MVFHQPGIHTGKNAIVTLNRYLIGRAFYHKRLFCQRCGCQKRGINPLSESLGCLPAVAAYLVRLFRIKNTEILDFAMAIFLNQIHDIFSVS